MESLSLEQQNLLLNQATELFLDQQLEAAESISLDLKQQQPMLAQNLNLLSLIQFNIGKHEQALIHAEAAVTLEPQTLDYLICLADILLQMSRTQEARACYLKALELSPDNSEILGKLHNSGLEIREHLAIVSCHGWSGSNWMATALNKHPEVICTHSARNLLSDGTTQDLRATVIERAQARNGRFHLRISDILDGIKQYGEAEVYSCVHTLRARDLPRYLQELPPNLIVSVANQLRHPVSVVSSGIGQLLELCEFDVFTLNEVTITAKEHAEEYYRICEAYQLPPGNIETLCSFDGCSHLRYLNQDIPIASQMSNFQMEKLVNERDYFRTAFDSLMEPLKADNEYLDQVFAIGRINPHRPGEQPVTPEQEWAAWPEWKKAMFRYFLQGTDILSFYSDHGYNLNFIEKA